MIGALRGAVAAQLPDGSVVVDVHGVGYRVQPSARARAGITPGDEVRLAIHTHVRDDAIVLYGFADDRERDCFEALLGAPGVGPALAQAILATLPPDRLATALQSDDVEALCAVPGVGRKTAARLLLELRGRLVLEAPPESTPALLVRQEVRGALSELGYTGDEVRRALEQLDATESVEDALRQALRALSRR